MSDPLDAVPLSELPVGSSGRIAAVTGPRRMTRRLLEMGMLPGTRVRVVRVAPLGDPLELQVRSYALSIRRAEAAGITLTDVRSPAPVQTVAAPARS